MAVPIDTVLFQVIPAVVVVMSNVLGILQAPPGQHGGRLVSAA